MRDGMTIVKTYTNETEAQLVLNQLKTIGVEGLIEADNCGGMRPHLDLTRGVNILVADQDLEQARAFLKEGSEKLVTYPWTCSSCGEEIEAGFDACWKCGAAKQG